MSKLFGLNKPNTNLRKNVFDLSEKNLYSSSVGLLTPLLCRELNPGEKVQVSVNALTRSMPLNTAAFVRSRQYFHYFFVPFRQLWSGWDNFINSVDYKTSSFQKDAIYSRVPGIDLFKSIADLLEDGYLTPAFNTATKQLEVPEGITIREYTTSYKNAVRGKKKKSPYDDISDADFVRYEYIHDLISEGREVNADDKKFYRELSAKIIYKDNFKKEDNNPATPPNSVRFVTEPPKSADDFNDVVLTHKDNLYQVSPVGGEPDRHADDLNTGNDTRYNCVVSAVDNKIYIYAGSYRRYLPNNYGICKIGGTYYVFDNTNVDTPNSTLLSLHTFVANIMDKNEDLSEYRDKVNFPDFPYFGTNSPTISRSLGFVYIDTNDLSAKSDNSKDVENSVIPASSGKPIEFAPDHVNKTLDEQGYSLVTGISRLLDMLEYGFTYVEYDEETQSYTQKASTLVDLLDSLNSKKINVLEWLRSEKNKCVVNPFRLLAYQKIYSDFYKRDDYEATNPLHWNIDDFKRGSAVMDFEDNKRLLNMLRLRYRWHNKDYFTGVVPSELLGGLQGFNANSLGMFGDNMTINSDDNKVSVGSGNVSTKGIRAMFALEKLMRLTRRAGGFDYISQTLAHYGFEPPRGRGDKVEFVGGTASNINISEVLSTADTSKGFTGQIYGRGIGSIDEKGKTEFTAKEHGILMCISSIVPDIDYSAEGLNSFNSKLQRGDYFQPEFQDLGLQPVFNYELYNRIYSDNMPENLRINKGVLGFSPRYAEYKAAFDKLHGEFRNGRTLSAWSAVSNVTDTNQGVARNSLKINPGVFNRVFSIEYNGHESTDHFLTSAQFECKIIRPMSVTGQNL